MNNLKKLDKQIVAKNVAKLIVESNFTHEQIAEMLDISTRVVYFWQKGERMPSMENVFCMSQLFKVSMESILSA